MVVEAPPQSCEVADPVSVPVGVGPHGHLVDDGVLPPVWSFDAVDSPVLGGAATPAIDASSSPTVPPSTTAACAWRGGDAVPDAHDRKPPPL